MVPTRASQLQLQFMQDLVLGGQASIAHWIVQVGSDTWAIHGEIPVDRDVIIAEFNSYGKARSLLDDFLERVQWDLGPLGPRS